MATKKKLTVQGVPIRQQLDVRSRARSPRAVKAPVSPEDDGVRKAPKVPNGSRNKSSKRG